MQARLLLKRFSQVAILAKAAYLSRAVQSSIPTAAYLQHMLSSPLHFVVKAVGPAMAPTINDGVAERAVGHAVLFRSISVLDPVRVGDVVAVSSPPMPPEACSPSSLSVAKSSHGAAPLLAIRRVAAVAGDELIASDNGDIIAVPPGCVWITCDNSNGDISSRVDSRVVGPVSVYELCGRALSIVSAGDRPAALSTNSLSVSEDLEWASIVHSVSSSLRSKA